MSSPTADPPRDWVVVPLRHPVRTGAASVVVALGILVACSLVSNERYRWEVVAEYMTASSILSGLQTTVVLTVVAMLAGVVGGTALALMRNSESRFLRSASWAYIWFFRGTPLLVQLIFWYNLAALYPTLTLGFPFGGPSLVIGDANTIVTVYVAAFLGLGLNESAYMAEIVRAGINAVDQGQTEAAQALGMNRAQVLRKVVLPQAMTVIIPPTGNQVIGMLKTTSLVSVITLPDLLYSSQLIYSREFNPIPLLIVVSLWYLALTSILTVVQYYIERKFNRGRAIRIRQTLQMAGVGK